jgi:hypothetical protein
VNEKNLVSFKTRTKQEMIEIGKKGAAASNQKQKEKKTFQSTIQALLDGKISKTDLKKLKLKHPDLKEEMTYREIMSIMQLKKSILESDTKAFEVVRDTGGEIIKKDDIPPNNNFYINIIKNEVK